MTSEAPVAPEHGKPWSPVWRQCCRSPSEAIERSCGQSCLRDHGDIDVTVTPAESAMSKAAYEIGSEQFGPELRLPYWDNTTSKVGSNLGGFIRCSMHRNDEVP
jgi:hypothetical protein